MEKLINLSNRLDIDRMIAQMLDRGRTAVKQVYYRSSLALAHFNHPVNSLQS